MEVLLIRHGKTAGNIAKRYIGMTDEPLCDEGIAHARLSGIDTGTASLYVSPLKRALETALIKFPNAQMTVCADLREMDFGDFEGRNAADMEHDDVYTKWVESNCMLRCPNGEQMDEFSDRICRAFDIIVRDAIDNGEERLVIVAHGGTIMSILGRYGKPEQHYYEWYVDNCCGYRAQLDESAWPTAPALIQCEKFETLY
jgi:alpha-ribazole phosphatase